MTPTEWAWKQEVGSPAARVILLAAALKEDIQYGPYSDVVDSCNMTSLEMSTAVRDLVDRGLIEVSQADKVTLSITQQFHTEPDWQSIYDAYPRKVGKPSAKRAILKALKVTPHHHLLLKTQEYARWCRDAKQDPVYIPHPATWFNDERYNDPLPDPMSSNPSLRNARIAELKGIIRNSPAFPGGPRWTDLATATQKSQYTEAMSELMRLAPDTRISELKR